jgi:hypothetical protein
MPAAANIINFSNPRHPNDHEYPWMIAVSKFFQTVALGLLGLFAGCSKD